MEKQLGFLRIKVQRGINLAVRDRTTSDPYVIVRMGKQKLQTRVVKKTLNPEWNEDLTFAIADPNLPIRLEVYDWDAFFDDKMGDVEIETKPFFKAVKMHSGDPPSGSVIIRVKPTHKNRLAEQSLIVWKDSKVVQNMILKLCNVECGKVVLQLQWIGKKLS